MTTIVLTGGGTAGHCTPNLALIPFLKNDFDKFYYIGSENGIEKEIISKTDVEYFSVPTIKLNRSFSLNNIKIPFTLLKGIKKAGKILDKIKPDVVFSKGGYVSVPTVIAANKRHIPVLSHESDLSMGLANKFTAKYCKKVLTAFPETAKTVKNGEYIGCPIRKSLYIPMDKKQILSDFGFSGKKPVLLITGGSQGARIINQSVKNALNKLLEKFDVIHICGKGNFSPEKIKGYYQTEYMDKIEKAFKVADVCVSRAGANTLFELLSLKIPCVIIPLCNNASRGDQVKNAEYFQKKGVITLLPQNSLTPSLLVDKINYTYENRQNIIDNLNKNPVKDCSRELSRIIVDCSR